MSLLYHKKTKNPQKNGQILVMSLTGFMEYKSIYAHIHTDLHTQTNRRTDKRGIPSINPHLQNLLCSQQQGGVSP